MKLNITFHNPNTVEEVAKELIRISAEVAKTQIREAVLHMEKLDMVNGQGEPA